MSDETLEAAFKKAIKAYWEQNDELDDDVLKPQKYNKKYFDERETEYLGEKKKDTDKNEK